MAIMVIKKLLFLQNLVDTLITYWKIWNLRKDLHVHLELYLLGFGENNVDYTIKIGDKSYYITNDSW